MPLPRVLVADDSATIRHLVQVALKPVAEVVGVADGRAALAELEKWVPALVLTDLNMPELGGRELVAAVRSGEATARLPILLMTTSAEKASIGNDLLQSVTAVLVKPFDAVTVLGLIRPLL